jgi:hypothetical protein
MTAPPYELDSITSMRLYFRARSGILAFLTPYSPHHQKSSAVIS